ncbi:peptidase P60 [Rhabdaerophilum calidifontis]|uniref:peptidase P60 n=1 Tax=Rhabdaerophilum calidifontis TaxID=2604328 RepID=UPI0012386C26|nr:peptidase P60 [Rhabdaerophilum calidifontis]
MSASAAPQPTRAAIVTAARGWIGTPYRHQASLRGAGCDCLGLLRGLWRELIGPEPAALGPYSPAWAEIGGGDPLIEAARRHLAPRADGSIAPGAVLLFRWRPGLPAKHCGIATAPDRMIHAHDGAAVAEVAIVPQWRRRLAATFDFPGMVD